MASYVARGLFKGLPQADLDELRAEALERIKSGDFKSLAGAGKSSSREWAMTPQEMLLEVKWAEDDASGICRATRVHTDLRERRVGGCYGG